jgi:hypothetical protein
MSYLYFCLYFYSYHYAKTKFLNFFLMLGLKVFLLESVAQLCNFTNLSFWKLGPQASQKYETYKKQTPSIC